MTIPRLFCGGFEEPDIVNEQGAFSAGANLNHGVNCHEPSHFVGWKPFLGVEQYYLQRRRAGEASWTTIYEGANSVYLDNTPLGGVYEYKTVPVDENGDAGIWSTPITFIVKPTIIVTASVTCNDISLSWTGEATQYKIYRDDTFLITTTNKFWQSESAVGGVFVYKVRAYISETCYGEGSATVTILVPQPAGTLLSSSCVGKNTIGVYADGNCGTTNQVLESWQCNGCFNPQMGLIGARSCSGNNVVQAAWSGTCDNNITSQVVETCSNLGCRNGECVTPPTCASMTTSLQLGLGDNIHSTINYDFGNKNIDGICVNVQSTWSNVAPSVAVFLDGFRVCMGSIPTDNLPHDILLIPPWNLAYGDRDPLSGTYTKWTGHITIIVSAQGQLYHGVVKLNSISWRNT